MALSAKNQAFSSPATLAGLTLIAAFFQVALIIPDEFSRFWWNDFRYFWFAGALWNEGLSPYDAEYMARGREAFTTFSAPFYYPPAMRLLVSPLALAPMQQAAAGFFLFNCALLFAACGLLARVCKNITPAIPEYLTASVFIAIGFVVLRQPLINAAIGQYTIVFLFCFTLFLYGVCKRSSAYTAIGLALLLIKPQFGAGLFVYCLLCKDHRKGAIIAVLIYAALTLWGMAPDFGDALPSFLHNLNAYTEHPVNLPEHSAGLNFLLAQINLELHAAHWLALVCLVAGAVSLAPKPETPLLAPLFIMTWSLVAAPTHATDLAMLLPCAGLLFLSQNKAMLIVVSCGFAIIGRSLELLNWLRGGDGWDLPLLTLANTVGLACILASIMYLYALPENGLRRSAGAGRKDALAQG